MAGTPSFMGGAPPAPTRGPFGYMPNNGPRGPVDAAAPVKSPFGGPASGPPSGNMGGMGGARGPPTLPPSAGMGGPNAMRGGQGAPGSYGGTPGGSGYGGAPGQHMHGSQGGMMGMAPQQQMDVIDDELQCDPLYMAPTVGVIPASDAIAKKMKVKMGAVIQPLAEDPSGEPVPVVNFGASSVIRCKNCRAYINPFVQFIENGRRWKCNMCSALNDVPKPYFCHLDGNGRRADLNERPELRKGQVEFVAPGEYMVRPPQAPCFVFVIDVSSYAVSSGMLQATVDTIKEQLETMPGNPRTQIGFITFDKVVQFYNLKHTLNAPQMMVVSDLNDVFLPVPEDLLVNLSESKSIVNQLLDALPEMFKANACQDAAVGAALTAAYRIMAHIGGKMCIFQASLPTLGPGALKHRGNPKLLGTEQEHTLLNAADPFYRTKASELIKVQIGVDLFLFSGQYTDVATLGNLPKFTGGATYYYPGFHPVRDGERFKYELGRTLTREMAWEAVARVRVTNGMEITNFFGNYQFRGKDLLSLPNFTADSTFSCEFVHKQPNVNVGTICMQSALLYTTSQGERRIRVNTIAMPTTSVEKDIFESIKVDALCNVMLKSACDKTLQSGLGTGRSTLQNDCTDILRAQRSSNTMGMGYGNMNTQQAQPGNALPESMALLPLNTMAMIKGLALRGGNSIRSDERAYIFSLVSSMPIPQSIPFIYPRMYALHNMAESHGRLVPSGSEIPVGALKCYGGDVVEMPEQMGLTAERLSSDGAFLLDNGVDIFMWFGRAVSPKLISSLFGLDTLDGIDCSQLRLEQEGDDICSRVNNIVRACRSQNPTYATIRVVQEGGPLETRFFMHLIEDRANFSGGAFSYAEFMGIIQRQSSGMTSTGAAARRY
jgi:protein transport protein SEC24